VFADGLEQVWVGVVQFVTCRRRDQMCERRFRGQRGLFEIRGHAHFRVLEGEGADQTAGRGTARLAEETGRFEAVDVQLGALQDHVDVAPVTRARDLEDGRQLLLHAHDALAVDGALVPRRRGAVPEGLGFLQVLGVGAREGGWAVCDCIRGRGCEDWGVVGVEGVVVAVAGGCRLRVGAIGGAVWPLRAGSAV